MTKHDDHVRMTDVEFLKGWKGGLPETVCGFGSKIRQTGRQRSQIPRWIKEHGIESVADIGAGDLNWTKLMDFGCPYSAYDLIPRVEGVMRYDLITQPLPGADCYLVMWVLNHLSAYRCKIAIDKFLASGARYLIMTYDKRMPDCTNLDPLDSLILRSKQVIEFELRLVRL